MGGRSCPCRCYPACHNSSLLQIWKQNCWDVTNPGATKDMGKMLGGDEEKDPDAAKKEEERQEALRQQEEERKAKYAKMEAEREVMRQGIRDKYGIKKKEEKEAEAQAALEANAEGSLTRPKKAIPPGCGDEEEEEEESILDTVIKYLPGPLQDMFKK
ncbi:complexin-1 isoform X1 [Vidua macroura]|uniref:complexin-1 isoform X1 n=1 Tax=Vidua macroura TaxID=187451 RepID=UPI0023A7D45A|nr:complexin-1 isoform X1 [Vidua macroura]